MDPASHSTGSLLSVQLTTAPVSQGPLNVGGWHGFPLLWLVSKTSLPASLVTFTFPKYGVDAPGESGIAMKVPARITRRDHLWIFPLHDPVCESRPPP